MGNKVQDILNRKGDFVLTVRPDDSAHEAIQRMVERNVGSVVVSEDGSLPDGIFSERDYLRRVTLDPDVPEDVPVREVMTSDLIVVDPTYEVEECLAIITGEKIRHLPVVKAGYSGEMVGIISIGDCVKHLSRERKTRIRYLEQYMTGGYTG